MLLRKPTLYNKLAWPAGIVPGFDPNHSAAAGMGPGHGFSAINMGGGFVSLLAGRPGTNSNSPTFFMDGSIGPSTNFSGATMQTAFSGQSTTVDLAFTIAAIVKFNSVAAAQYIFSNTSAGAGLAFGIGITSGAVLNVAAFGVGNSSNAAGAAVADTPYFSACSGTLGAGGTTSFVLTNLKTGASSISVNAASAITPGTPNGTFVVGNRNTAAGSTLGKIAAVMYAPQKLPLTALLQWSSDPWSFWYPRNIDLTQIMSPAVAAGGSFLAAWAQNSNLPVLGTGTY